ncbi:MAG: hypothetical protein JNG84_11095 [Archangium sp.]|nr:hypothetical protein [Archangium sp.]
MPTLLEKLFSDRRTDTQRALARFSEIAVESSWRPTDKAPVASEGWLRANGYAPDRRIR